MRFKETFCYHDTPFGILKLCFKHDTLQKIHFVFDEQYERTEYPPVISTYISQLDHYFSDPSVSFNIKLPDPKNPFQQQFREALLAIPPGKTQTYGELAKKLHTSPQAIGQACRHNPLPIIIPCHRVVGKNDLGGFAGDLDGPLIKVKRWLLSHEGVGIIAA